MRIIHVMADGSTKESIEGVVIENEQFYEILKGILERVKA